MRPDPDELIERLRDDEAKARRGRLRIYFGSSAGVGKTYAMLAAARASQATGTDVVAGVVETHGRAETAAQLHGLVVLPRRPGAAAESAHAEFDLDAALARKPGLILLDELAHSNAPGSRHPKRWQDAEELLAAGIDVWTTLNVQHLESLNDIVGGITGVLVRETLPDTFFDKADEVVLVDTPAEELLSRLKAGKVYAEAQAERAAANFFRKGNLMALRELALRRTADRVGDDVQAWRVDREVGQVWKTEAALLCCIGPSEGNEHVVRSSAQLAQQLAVSWHAVFVETPALQRLPSARRQRILEAVKLAENLGATTAVLPSSGVAAAVLDHARQHNLSKIVMGHNRASFWRPAGTLAQQLGRVAPDVDLIEIGAVPAPPRPAQAGADSDRGAAVEPTGYLVALAACAGTTIAALPLGDTLALPNVVMLFLIAVVAVALRYGRGPAALSSVLNVAAFDFFFVPPRYSFAVADVQYVLTFAVMLAVGLVVGQLTAGLRYQAQVATHRERRSHALFEVARDLSSVLATEQVVAAATDAVAREFRGRVHLFLLDGDDRLALASPANDDDTGLDSGAARWAFDHAQDAGMGTDTLPGSAWRYLPLKAPMRTRGVLALKPEEPRLLLVPEQRRQLETFAALTAIALERVHYVDVARQATVQIETERLRNSLLAALSHDLRTPLAGVVGMAESLRLSAPALSAGQQEIADDLRDEALRMSTQVNNLLDMARIESGDVHLRHEWHSVEELVGSSARVAGRLLRPRELSTDVPADLPLVECDAVLIERVLVNLLENAAKYTPPASHVRVSARAEGGAMRITVADDGPGVARGQEREIFEKFTRGVRESSTSGVGLGLAICKAIVEAHGGSISAQNLPTGGAAFTFSLPLGEPPAVELGSDEAARATA